MGTYDQLLVVDGHSDILSAVLPERTGGFVGRSSVLEQDFVPGMKKGGIDVRVLAIYSYKDYMPELALRRGLDQVAALYAEAEESPSVALCTSVGDILRAKENGQVGLVLGMEGAEPLGQDLSLLRIFYELGLRVLGLTHIFRTYAADPALIIGALKTGMTGGLSPFGVRLVETANDLGIVIDVSHLNDPGFWDVLEFSRHPVIASHSNCRALYDSPRNLTDEQIKALAAKGGVIGLNAITHIVGNPGSTLDHLLDHLDHIVQVGGIQSVGFGFDFADYLPKYLGEADRMRIPDLGAVSGLSGDAEIPNLIHALAKRGYKEEEIELIAGKNLLRVFGEVWKSEKSCGGGDR